MCEREIWIVSYIGAYNCLCVKGWRGDLTLHCVLSVCAKGMEMGSDFALCAVCVCANFVLCCLCV